MKQDYSEGVGGRCCVQCAVGEWGAVDTLMLVERSMQS